MIGRLRVVSNPTSASKKSARWLIWKPACWLACPTPIRPAPVITWRETRNPVNWVTTRSNGVLRSSR